jgi:hypothetical protein
LAWPPRSSRQIDEAADDVGVDGGVGAAANLDVLLGGEGRRSGGQGHGRSGQNKQSLHVM